VVGELIADRYELERLVGTGGMSSVYCARDRLLERKVALKILHEHHTADDDYVERFRHEARAVAQLAHPNIVTVIDRGEQDGRQFIVFEFVDGENLKELVEREGRLPVREAIELALQVGRALAFAHEHGLVHRDVKPQNVLLIDDGRAKVTDFGIARELDVEGMTTSGMVLGTSEYIAPEQARGEPVGPHTDVYSLGVVLYELLAGEVPFRGESFVAIAMRHVNDPVPSLRARRPEISGRLDAAISRAMAKDPADRWDSMDGFLAELENCLLELDAEAGDTMVVAPSAPPSAAVPVRRRRERRTLSFSLPLALALLALAAIAGAVVAVLTIGVGGVGPVVKKKAASPSHSPVRLSGLSGYDPYGSGGEHDADASKATDGNPATAWSTEHYRSFDKPGVGLLLDAHRSASPGTFTLVTTTPGFTALIRAGDSPSGPFRPVSAAQTVSTRTVFNVKSGTKAARYYVVWITSLGSYSSVEVNEVKAR
jgi:serine/threonine-protein kinase